MGLHQPDLRDSVITCRLHPDQEAGEKCEYCAELYCAACLRLLLGRRYCPECLPRVLEMATGQPQGASRAQPASPTLAKAGGRRLPGWLSAGVYLAGFAVVDKLAAEGLLRLPLLLARASIDRVPLSHVTTRSLMSASGIGLLLWCFFWGVVGWGSLLVVLAITAALGYSLEHRSLAGLGLLPQRSSFRDLLVGLGLPALLFLSVVGLGAGRDLFDVRLSPAGVVQAPFLLPAGLLLLLPFAAVWEIGMRGYVLQAASRSWGAAGGAVASGAAFALLHGQPMAPGWHPLAYLGLFLAGLYFASAYFISGSLWLPIFLHTGWLLAEGPVFGLPLAGSMLPVSVFSTHGVGSRFWSGGGFGPEAGLLLVLLMAVHLAVLWMLRPLLRPASDAQAPTLAAEQRTAQG